MNPYPNQKIPRFCEAKRFTTQNNSVVINVPSPVKLLRERYPDFPPSIDSGLFGSSPQVPHVKGKRLDHSLADGEARCYNTTVRT
ncbi:BQ5605_C012g06969 [Microbotryum silenes-dioicae]|uniref:BQ5605_C012g06969 protein n=1 Tax=Microbotryum silenes-dioicae TaxID=796604 RepID=A0A2X0MM20_9BASI|nr:BQ5605_C012g06969 [Microbotryum silenes-dioicae]